MMPHTYIKKLLTLLFFALSTFIGTSSGLNFSHESGYYENNFILTINTDSTGASIIYTLDGSNPQTSSTSLEANSSIDISINPNSNSNRTITPAFLVRASYKSPTGDIAFSESRTFIFLDEVKAQSYPGGSFPASPVNEQVFNYGMDASIINSSQYQELIDDAFMEVPTISLITENDHLFDPDSGIYVNAAFQGELWERPCAVELLSHKGNAGFNLNAGLRIRGGHSRKPSFPKHSLKLFFRGEYGAKKLDYPLFGENEISSFDKIDFTAPQSFGWSTAASENTTFLRDIFSRNLQGEMGRPHTQSFYFHLFLNGLYWGLYQTQERADANYAADYLGGDAEDYDIIKIMGMREDGSGTDKLLEASDGTIDKWQEIYNLCDQGFVDNEDYFALGGKDEYGQAKKGAEVLVDIDNLIDYTLIIFYTGNYDASPSKWTNNSRSNNITIITNHTDKTMGAKFLVHDAEFSLFTETSEKSGDPGVGLYENRVEVSESGQWYSMTSYDIQTFHSQWLHKMLSENEEYRIRFADRAYKHLTGNGLMTPTTNLERFNQKALEIDTAIIAESARWGDGVDDSYPTRTKDNAWLPALNNIRNNYFPYRTDIVIGQLEDYELFPSITAPEIKSNTKILEEIEVLENSIEVSFTNPDSWGTIYYTLDGSDPRLVGGAISTSAISIETNSSINISQSTTIKARIKQQDKWSAIVSSSLLAQQTDFSHFKVTEMNYHPLEEVLTPGDTLGAKKFEFIEFRNTSTSQSINLTGLSIDSGIRYEFPDNYILKPLEYFVVAAKPRFFYERYGVMASGNFSKNLSNSSERIVVNDAHGNAIIDLVYSDDAPWPVTPDGDGPSLSSAESLPTGDPNEPNYWTASISIHGTPFSNEEHPSNITANQQLADINIYPNPTKGLLHIEIPSYNNSQNQVSLYNINGLLIYQSHCGASHSISMNSQNIHAGFYLIKISSGDNSITKRIIYTP